MKFYNPIKIILPQWLLLALLSIQSILFSADAAAIELVPPVAIQTEWLSDLGFLKSRAISFSKAHLGKAFGKKKHPFSFYFNLSSQLSLNTKIEVHFAFAKWNVLQFNSPIFFLQQYIYVKASDDYFSPLS